MIRVLDSAGSTLVEFGRQQQQQQVLIPRIKIKRQDEQFIEWNRRQFQVTLAFAMTINKTQGQTQRVVGVRLEEPTFTHGQYLHFAVIKSVGRKTRNVAYEEIL